MSPLREDIACQAADLLNTQNKLTEIYDGDSLRWADGYIVHTDGRSTLFGIVRVQRVQWYQAELTHLSVNPEFHHHGIGQALIREAEEKALRLHAKTIQCVLRLDNIASENLFRKCGYSAGPMFINRHSGNILRIYQKVLWSDM
jgi:ribosomal protein S18 acetylase RimI-like enzyme